MIRFSLMCLALVASVAARADDAPQDCEALAAEFSKYDKAARFYDRATARETSAARAQLNQTTVTNILIRQNIVLDMMVAKNCGIPPVPQFPVAGHVDQKN